MHGERFREPIHEIAEIRMDLLCKQYLTNFSREEIDALAANQIETLKGQADLYAEFMGIAEGADISPLKLAVLNNYTDMRNEGKNEAGCTAIVHRSPKTVVAGQTWDMDPSALPYVLYMQIQQENGCEQHLISIVGCLGMMGVSSTGVSALMNDLKTTETGPGLMWPALIRSMLNTQNAESAKAFLAYHLPTSGHHYLVSDKTQSFSIETTGRRYEVVAACEHGTIAHTNHYLGKLGSSQVDQALSLTTAPRLEAAHAYFQKNSESTTLGKVAEELFGTALGQGGCMMSGAQGAGSSAITCGGLLVDHLTGEGLVFHGGFTKEEAIPFSCGRS